MLADCKNSSISAKDLGSIITMHSQLGRTYWQLGPYLMQSDLLERQLAQKSQQSRKSTKKGVAMQGGKRLRWIIKGVEELRPASSFWPKRVPVTISILTDLNNGLSRSSGLDVCGCAICLLSFFCQLCSGEHLSPTQDLVKFKPHRHATFCHITESTVDNSTCNLHLPWSKTQKA